MKSIRVDDPDHLEAAWSDAVAADRPVVLAVRDLDPTELIITDGFSCREQIEQTTSRTPTHIAELLQQAIHQSRP